MKNDKVKATVNGEEVEVEMISEYEPPHEKEKNKTKTRQKFIYTNVSWVPLAVALVILGGIIILSVFLFIWMLPVLIPLFLIFLIFGFIKNIWSGR